MTSRPGLTEAARWMMTASVIDEVMHTRSPNVSVAHAITSWAGASASSCAAAAASPAIRLDSPMPSGVLRSGVVWSGEVGQVALDLTGRLPSRNRARTLPRPRGGSPWRYLRVVHGSHGDRGQ